MPMNPNEVGRYQELVRGYLVGVSSEFKSKDPVTGEETIVTKKNSTGLVGEPKDVVEALLSITEPRRNHHVSPSLQSGISSVKELLDNPDMYVQSPGGYDQFRGVILNCIQERINELQSLRSEEAQKLFEDQAAMRNSAAILKARVARTSPPGRSGRNTTLMLSNEDYDAYLAREVIRIEDEAIEALNEQVPDNEIIGASQDLLRIIIVDENVRKLITENDLSFSEVRGLFEQSRDKLYAISRPTVRGLMEDCLVPFSRVSLLYDESPEKLTTIAHDDVRALHCENYIYISRIMALYDESPAKLLAIAKPDVRNNLMGYFKLSVNDLSRLYDETSSMYPDKGIKLFDLSKTRVRRFAEDCNVHFEQISECYSKAPDKLYAISGPSVRRLVKRGIATLDQVSGLYDADPDKMYGLSGINFTSRSFNAYCNGESYSPQLGSSNSSSTLSDSARRQRGQSDEDPDSNVSYPSTSTSTSTSTSAGSSNDDIAGQVFGEHTARLQNLNRGGSNRRAHR